MSEKMVIEQAERDLEKAFLVKLASLKYEYRSDIHDRASLESNFRKKFE
jgi:type I restriction enzyme R subunit